MRGHFVMKLPTVVKPASPEDITNFLCVFPSVVRIDTIASNIAVALPAVCAEYPGTVVA